MPGAPTIDDRRSCQYRAPNGMVKRRLFSDSLPFFYHFCLPLFVPSLFKLLRSTLGTEDISCSCGAMPEVFHAPSLVTPSGP